MVDTVGLRRRYRSRLFLQVALSPMAVGVHAKYDEMLWRPLSGGSKLDGPLDRALCTKHAFAPELVLMAAAAFGADDEAVRLVDAGTDGRNEWWWAALAASVANRAAFHLDLQSVLAGVPLRSARDNLVSVLRRVLSIAEDGVSALPARVIPRERP